MPTEVCVGGDYVGCIVSTSVLMSCARGLHPYIRAMTFEINYC